MNIKKYLNPWVPITILKMSDEELRNWKPSEELLANMNFTDSDKYIRRDGMVIPKEDGYKLKEEDWYTLGSIVGDLAGLGLSAAGLSVPAALSGAASTTSQLISDIKKDGFQLGDLGSAALGYGLDLATFIPGLGVASSFVKNSKKLAKVAPWILSTFGTLLSGAGLSNSIDPLKKLASGNTDLTMDDWRALTNGLMGLVGLKNSAKGFKDAYRSNKKVSEVDTLPVVTETIVKPATKESVKVDKSESSYAPTSYSQLPEDHPAVLAYKKRLAAKAGLSAADRNILYKANPLEGTATSESLMTLINRVKGPIQWLNGNIVWPLIKLKQSDYTTVRPTVHFTTHLSVLAHGNGNWDAAPTTILVPYKTAVEHNGLPLNIHPMDTYWSNATSFQLPGKKVKVFTGDLQEATKARLNGADVTFSKDVAKLRLELNKICSEMDDINKKTDFWPFNPKHYSTYGKRYEELKNEYLKLSKKMRGLHEEFILANLHTPSLEDYKLLESETGLDSKVGTWDNPAAFGSDEKGGLSYSHDPRDHSSSWFGANEASSSDLKIDSFLSYLKNYGYKPSPSDNITTEEVNRLYRNLLNDLNLIILLLEVLRALKSSPDKLKQVLKEYEDIPDNIPNIKKLKKILSGERVFQYLSGGKINYIDLFK